MKIKNGILTLDDSTGYSPSSLSVSYTDTDGNRICIPMKLLIRLYEGCKYHHERNGGNWEEYTNSLFECEVDNDDFNQQ